MRAEDKVSRLKEQLVKSKAMKELNQVDLKDSIYLTLSWTNPGAAPSGRQRAESILLTLSYSSRAASDLLMTSAASRRAAAPRIPPCTRSAASSFASIQGESDNERESHGESERAREREGESDRKREGASESEDGSV